MTNVHIFPQLDVPETIAAGPGPGNTDARVMARFVGAGLADHMHPAVLRGMVECKEMLRDVMGTKNVHTFGVAGTGWSGLDVMFSAVMPGDTVVMFVNGTFSGIDGLTVRMKAATAEELAANSLDPQAASVTIIDVPHGQSVTGDIVDAALAKHKPKWAAMAHWETGSGRVSPGITAENITSNPLQPVPATPKVCTFLVPIPSRNISLHSTMPRRTAGCM